MMADAAGNSAAARGGKLVVGAGERKLLRDLKLLSNFICIYCRQRHPGVEKTRVRLKGYDLLEIHGKPVRLCRSCQKLLAHAFVKRTHCPLEPKPMCKKCPAHCYAPKYRAAIREVMKYSGRRLVLSGRLDYLLHLVG
ncbi:MAG: nitrous oxide-stimulated promoter family protein [Phycisphaerae bacterium]